MKWKTESGAEFDLPDLAAVEKTIRAYEADLKKLRRIRDLLGEVAGVKPGKGEREKTVAPEPAAR